MDDSEFDSEVVAQMVFDRKVKEVACALLGTLLLVAVLLALAFPVYGKLHRKEVPFVPMQTAPGLAPQVLRASLWQKGDERIGIKVFPPIVQWSKSAQVRVTLRIPDHPANRFVMLGWDQTYPGEGGHSQWDLPASTPNQRNIGHLIPGTMWVYADLYYEENGKLKTQRVETSVIVAGG